MPIRSRFAEGAFDPETIRLLSAAFEDAWQSLNGSAVDIGPGTDAMRDALARSIIDAASRGERDPHRLREAALLHLARSIGRDPDA